MINRISATLLAALLGALPFAPAALANEAVTDLPTAQTDNATAAAGTATSAGSKPMGAQPHAGMMMSAAGPSVPFLVHHAYKEALHAQESVAMGMNAMATNHLENVGLVLGGLDLTRDVTDAKVRTQLTQIRDQARSLGGSPTLAGSQQLVGRFVGLVAAMPMPQTGGGGGAGTALTPMLHLPGELVAMAAGSAADAQVDASQRNFAGARLHAQHAVAALDQALASARLHQLQGARVEQIQALRGRAGDVLSLVSQSSPQAVQASGQLVTQIGNALPMLTKPMAQPGGGAMERP